MSFLYLISEGETGPVKVGVAKNPITRLTELQTGNPRQLRLVDAWEMDSRQPAFDAERKILAQLKDERLIGEWVAISEAEALTIIPVFLEEMVLA